MQTKQIRGFYWQLKYIELLVIKLIILLVNFEPYKVYTSVLGLYYKPKTDLDYFKFKVCQSIQK
jgi:hypothetical protein